MTVGINFLTPFHLQNMSFVVLFHVWDIVAVVKNSPKKDFPTPNISHGLNKITSRAWYLIWNTCQNRKDDKKNVCSWTFCLLFNSTMNLKTTEIYPGTSEGSQPSAAGATGLSYLTLYSIWLHVTGSKNSTTLECHCTDALLNSERSISRI